MFNSRNRGIMALQRQTKSTAFCPELNQTLTAAQLWELIFQPSYAQPRYHLADLTLKCSHTNCQALLRPMYFGIHSHKDCVKFRKISGSPIHSDDCPLFVPLKTATTVSSVLETPRPERSQHIPYIPPHLRARQMYRDMKASSFNLKASN